MADYKLTNLTDLYPSIFNALDVVSRELVGITPASTMDASYERAAKGQTVTSPVAPEASATDLEPAQIAPDNGDQSIGNVQMTIDKVRGVPIRWNGEQRLAVDNNGAEYNVIFRDQMAQAMRTLTNEVEADLAAEYVRASRAYGTAGTTPFGSDLSDTAQMRKILADNGAPMGDLQLTLDTTAGANMRSLTNLTNVGDAGGDDMLRRGELLNVHGFAIRESAGFSVHTGGTATDVTVSGANAVGATVINVTTAASTGSVDLSPGDVIDIAGQDHRYVIAEAVTIAADSTGDVTIAAPGLVEATSGSEDVTVASDYTPNLAFARSALALAARAPAIPDQGDQATDAMTVTDPMSGITFEVRMYAQYRQVRYEVGLAWGAKLVKPAHAAILLG